MQRSNQIYAQPTIPFPLHVKFALPTFLPPLTSDWSQPPLSSRMKDSFIQNNTWEGPLVYRHQTSGGRRMWFNGCLSCWREKEKKEKEKKGSVRPSASPPAAFNIWSLAVSLGSWSIDLILYQTGIKSCWEIAFCGVRGLATGAAWLAFCQQISL